MRIILPTITACLLFSLVVVAKPSKTRFIVPAGVLKRDKERKRAPDTAQNVLLYNKAATEWLEALPVGNGSLGAMIFGGVANEKLQFNESSLVTGTTTSMGNYQPFGEVLISFPGLTPENYTRSLDLKTAVHEVSFISNGVTYKRRCFASYPDKVIVLKLSATRPGKISFTIKLNDSHAANISVNGNKITSIGKLTENQMDYEAKLQVLNTGGTVTATTTAITVAAADEVTIHLTAGTSFLLDYNKNFRGALPAKKIDSILNKSATQTYAQLYSRHSTDYQTLFNRVQFNIGKNSTLTTLERINAYKSDINDPNLEALLFQYGRYLLISSSRKGGLPTNLQGIWNDQLKPTWYSQYTTDINVEMNYWLAEPTALAECTAPYFDWVENLGLVQKNSADPKLKTTKGWIAYSTNNIMGGNSGYVINRPGSAWLSQHFWEHYAFGGDKQFLLNRGYPLIKEVSAYWQDHLTARTDGKLITPDGWSPEHGPHLVEGDKTTYPGVSYDQEIVYDLFTNYMDVASALSINDADTKNVTTMRGKLLVPQIGKWGQLQEWMDDVDDPADHHRHNSHLFAVFPGRQIDPANTPSLAAAALKSVDARGVSGIGWSNAWRIAIYARLQKGDRAHDLIKALFNKSIISNLFDLYPPFQIDANFGYTAGVAEMLLQSQVKENGYYILQLLPALPTLWNEGNTKGLRARGGFEVNIDWANGLMTTCTVKSLLGNTLKLAYNNKSIVTNTVVGKTYKFDANLLSLP